MRINYELRPTMIKSNARFRGPTESEKYFNTIQEALHDITLLGKVMDMDGFIFSLSKGQTNFIRDNMAVYFSGDEAEPYSNESTATVLYSNEGVAVEDTNLVGSGWTAYGQCIRSEMSGVTHLTSPGNVDPCGVSYELNVQEGQIIYIRAFVRRVNGNADHFTIGSHNINNGVGSVASFEINPEGMYVGHFLECQHKEGITINIDVNNGATSSYDGEVAIDDLSITYVEKSELYLKPINSDIKSRINVLDNEIQNIINNM
jgi:hypothetical protein